MDWCTFGSLVQHGGNAEDEVSADVRHRCLDDTLAVLQTPITLKCFPCIVPTGVPPSEYLQVFTMWHQHNLRTEKMMRAFDPE